MSIIARTHVKKQSNFKPYISFYESIRQEINSLQKKQFPLTQACVLHYINEGLWGGSLGSATEPIHHCHNWNMTCQAMKKTTDHRPGMLIGICMKGIFMKNVNIETSS